MKENNSDVGIDVPEAYGNRDGSTTPERAVINPIPSLNKVKRRVIRGVLKHDTAQNKQE